MSFYEDASLVFLAAGAAGKDGKAYNVKPSGKVTTKNLVDNGTFDSSTNWVADAGWSIADGKASTTGAQISSIDLVQTTTYANLAEGRPYKLQYTVSNYAAGTLSAFVRGTAAGTASADGTYIEYATSGSDTDAIKFTADSSFRGKIDDVSIVEVESIPADFDFTRGSNLSATRVGKDGYIEKGRENLLLQSNQFDTTWFNNGTTETSGQTGYDGSSNAWLLEKTVAGGSIRQSIVFNGVGTYSVYAKAGTKDWLRLVVLGSPSNRARYFDLANGTTGSSVYSTEIDSTITSVGGGWYRCTITTSISITEVRIYPADGDGINTATSGNIYIQDAQLEQGLVATDYLESGATTGKAGVLENLPRIDYTGGSASLLLEPQRKNELAHSEYFGGWSIKSGATETSNSIISPDGLQNASTISETTALTNYIGQNYTFTASTEYSYSVFVKNGTSSKMRLQVYDSSQYSTIDFDQSDSVTYSANLDSYDFVDYGNGWRRVIITFTTSAGAGSGYVQIYPDRNGNNEYLYAYGAQLEEGSYATSYIPTYGTSVTRNADSCVATSVSDLIGQTEGTLFAEVDVTSFKEGLTSDIILSAYTNTANRIMMSLDGIGTKRAVVFIRSNSVSYDYSTDKNFSLGTNKLAFSYGENYRALYLNGEKISEDTSTFPVPPIANLGIGRRDDNSGQFGDGVKQTLIFNTRLTDGECIALTTL